jgi:hypothetical protein
MQVTGSCYCGRITVRAEIDPADVTICHCTDCQRLTGTAYRVSVSAPAESLVIEGEPKSFVKRGESGRSRRHGFCSDCGSPIFSAALDDPSRYTLRVGLLDQRARLEPQRRIWCRSALDWSLDITDVPGAERQ